MNPNYPVLLWLWGLGQATCIGLATLLLLAAGARLAPALRARIAAWSLCLMACAPVLMFVPLEGFFVFVGDTATPSATAVGARAGNEQRGAAPARLPASVLASKAAGEANGEAVAELWSRAWSGLGGDAAVASSEPNTGEAASAAPAGAWTGAWASWPLWLGAWIIGWCALGFLRMFGGLWQIRNLRRQAQVCTDERLLGVGKACQTALGIATPIEWLQDSAIGSPAVVGVRQPAIILPAECVCWSDQQLLCAIAHELAHVKRRDVMTTLAAQLALVVNYFHPIGHLLANRLRLDQELSADCLAAPIAGGQRLYLETLAALALDRVHVNVGRTALPFLPTRRTFVRRLEMLRHLRLTSSRAARWQSILLPASLVALAVLAIFLRPAFAQPPSQQTDSGSSSAQSAVDGAAADARAATQAGQPAASPVPELLTYLPDAATAGVLVVEVEKLLQAPHVAALLAEWPPEQRTLSRSGFKLNVDDIESVMLIASSFGPRLDPAAVVRLKTAAKMPQPTSSANSPAPGYGFPSSEVAPLDQRTFLWGANSKELKPVLMLAAASNDRGDLRSLIRRESESVFKGALRVSLLRSAIEPDKFGFLGPLVRDVPTLSFGGTIGQQFSLRATLDTANPKAVKETLEALRTLAKNALESLPETLSAAQNKTSPKELMLLVAMQSVASTGLENLTITAQPAAVQVTTAVDQPSALLAGWFRTAVSDARAASDRARELASLRQIVLALHNYHHAHGQFPPAIVTENGVERSWRVEILPYLGQQDLYDKYRKDEPWDGPNNRRLAQVQVPAYAPQVTSTDASADRSLTSIRGIGGERGILGKQARGLREIFDGTSNTLIVVEVNDMVPWTKPEEYAPTAEQLLAAGSRRDGLLGAFADGACKWISKSIDPRALQAMMTMNGGEPVTALPEPGRDPKKVVNSLGN